MRIIFIDTETTGLNPHRNEIDPTLGNCILSYTIQAWTDGVLGPAQTIHLLPTCPVEPGAAKVNGYSPEEWARRGATRSFGWEDCTNLNVLHDAIVGGHNVPFDLDFVAAEFARGKVASPKWNHRKVDTQALSMPLVALGAIKSAALAHVAAYWGIDHSQAHTSAGDVTTTIQVWERYVDLYLRAAGR